MLHLNKNLKKELSKSIVDFWIDSPQKYCEIIGLVEEHGVWNATLVMLEETWYMAEKLVDKTFLRLLEALFPYLRQAIEEEFAYFIRTGEVAHVQDAR